MSTMGPDARHRISFALVLLGNFFCLCISCALEPLLPPLATIKGMSSSLSGLFFGLVVLLAGFTNTVTRPLLSFINIKFSMVSGAFCGGVCSILTGVLQYAPSGPTFIGLCFAVNIIGSIGNGFLVMAAYSALPVLYPQKMGFAGGCILLSTTAAFALSPAIAGSLSDVGGFILPMILFGVTLIITGIFSAIFLDVEVHEDESFTEIVKAGGKVVVNPPIVISMLTILFSTMATGFTSPTLEPFLRTAYKLPPTYIGLLFMVSAIGGFISPLIGLVCDRSMMWTKFLQAPGQVFCGFSILLWNPSPILNLGGPKLWLTGVSLATFGLAMSQLMGSAIADLFQESERRFGNSELHASVTAVLFNLIYTVGLFIGSLLGGFALDTIGFVDATTVLGCSLAGLSVFNVIYQLIRIKWIKKPSVDVKTEISSKDGNSMDDQEESTRIE